MARLDDCEVARTNLKFGSTLDECLMSPEDEKLFFTADFMMVPAVLEVTKLRIAVQNLCAGFAASAEYLFLGLKVSSAGKKRQGPKMHLRELTLAAPCIDCPFGLPPFS
ncbi:MAG: hypothetical protein H7279_11440 [Microbacteriaceae bacterium]|nr:hypothetical protein [Microbacteriaceae bacterium]